MFQQPRQGWTPPLPAWLLWISVMLLLDGVWIALDHSVPAWDQADHLSRAMDYWQVLQDPEWLSGSWWHRLWSQSTSYRAPLVYLATMPVFKALGTGWHQAMVVNLLFTLPLLLVMRGWVPVVGEWVGWVVIMPFLVAQRTNYLLDYGLMVVLFGTWVAMTRWRNSLQPSRSGTSWRGSSGRSSRLSGASWGWAAVVGLGIGLTVLTRPTGILFLVVPGLWLLISMVKRRQWLGIPQVLMVIVLAVLVAGFWVSTNWLTILTSIDKARAWGGIYQAGQLPAWRYYLQALPELIGWPVVVVGLAGWLLPIRRQGSRTPLVLLDWPWLLAFCLGGYGLGAVSPSYDPRFILPILPVVLLLLLGGLVRVRRSWRWITLGLSLGVLVIQQFWGSHAPDYRGGWPHEEVIAAVVDAAPELRSTVGVIPLTATVNPFNLNFYGALRQGQVYGRQLSFDPQVAIPESRALDWYVTKSGDQGIVLGVEDGQLALSKAVERQPELTVVRRWPLPDGSTLSLHHRKDPAVQAIRLTPSEVTPPVPRLLAVIVPSTALPAAPIPVQYTWQGSRAQFQQGVVLVDWRTDQGSGWIQDHAIGFGAISSAATPDQDGDALQVKESLAMLGSRDPGVYRLQVSYWDPVTGTRTPMDSPPVTVTITPTGTAQPAPELDRMTQFRQLGSLLQQGQIDPVFATVARLNQHDPTQDYYGPLAQSLAVRLTRTPEDLSLLYPLLLVQVLQKQAAPALETLQVITTLEPKNPYAWVYQAVVSLYQWDPQAASGSLAKARALQPNLPELATLEIVAAVQEGNGVRLWQLLHPTGREQ